MEQAAAPPSACSSTIITAPRAATFDVHERATASRPISSPARSASHRCHRGAGCRARRDRPCHASCSAVRRGWSLRCRGRPCGGRTHRGHRAGEREFELGDAMIRLCTICARGGSRGVVGKNIRPLLGKPLIAWTIEQATSERAFQSCGRQHVRRRPHPRYGHRVRAPTSLSRAPTSSPPTWRRSCRRHPRMLPSRRSRARHGSKLRRYWSISMRPRPSAQARPTSTGRRAARNARAQPTSSPCAGAPLALLQPGRGAPTDGSVRSPSAGAPDSCAARMHRAAST